MSVQTNSPYTHKIASFEPINPSTGKGIFILEIKEKTELYSPHLRFVLFAFNNHEAFKVKYTFFKDNKKVLDDPPINIDKAKFHHPANAYMGTYTTSFDLDVPPLKVSEGIYKIELEFMEYGGKLLDKKSTYLIVASEY